MKKSVSTPAVASLLLVVVLLVSACQPSARANSNTGEKLPVPTSGALAQVTGTPFPDRLEATQALPVTGALTQNAMTDTGPQIVIHNQDVSSGQVIADRVVSRGAGWLVIHQQAKDGTMGDPIGYTAVKDGVNDHVTVAIPPGKVTPVLIALLHSDAGVVGVFEYPGVDQPVVRDGQVVLSVFSASPLSAAAPAGAAAPTIEAPSQAVTQTPSMGGMANMGQPAATQAATPAVEITDQQVKNGAVQASRVVSDGPGWIVIYTVKNGQPDTAIGRAPVHAGENRNISVAIDASKATGTLEGILHTDAGQVGTFEYPGPDAPVVVGLRFASAQFNVSAQQAVHPGGGGQANNPPPASTARPRPYILVNDQPIHEGQVVISEIYSDGVSWLVIHPTYPDGTLGSYIGYALLKDGLNRNVRVPVDTSRTTHKLMAMLHVNASKASLPQYPGVDGPVMINGQMIAPTFNVLGPLAGDVLLTAFTGADGSTHLADSFGMTLYADVTRQPQTCNPNAGCLFRPLTSSGEVHAGAGVPVDKIGVIPLADGTKWFTYGGAPLYYCIKDQNSGDTSGQRVDGRWYVVTP